MKEFLLISGKHTKLELEFQKHDLLDIYEAFLKHEITHDLAWSLTKDELKEIGLTLGQQKRYLAAAKKDNKASTQNPVTSNKGALIAKDRTMM